MKALLNSFTNSGEYKSILDSLISRKQISITGPMEMARVHFCSCLLNDTQKKGVFVAHNELRARKFYEDFEGYFGDDALFLSPRDILLYNTEARSNETLYNRISVLERIFKGDYKILVTSCEAVVQKLMDPKTLFDCNITVSTGDSFDIENLAGRLLKLGYERASEVDGKGQFCIRGGIVDIFIPSEENAIRIDFFGDDVDSIRSFDILTQRSIENIQEVIIIPASEIIYTNEEKDNFIEKIKHDLNEFIQNNIRMNQDEKQEFEGNINKDIEKFQESHYFQGEEKYLSYILNKSYSVFDYCPENTLIFVDEVARFVQRIENIEFEMAEMCKNLTEKKLVLPSIAQINFASGFIHNRIQKNANIILNSVTTTSEEYKVQTSFDVACRQIFSYNGKYDVLSDDVASWKKKAYKVVIVADTSGKAEKVIEALRDAGVECVYDENGDNEIAKGQATVVHAMLRGGFEFPEAGFVVVGNFDITGQSRKKRRRVSNKTEMEIQSFTDLSPGDYVVHHIHGIGVYCGIEELKSEGITRDYFKINYQGDGSLYVPINRMDLIQKYIGAEGKRPKVNKLGSGDWERTKAKVKQSLRKIAAGLIKLYAKRQTTKGFEFSKDTVWQAQFEEDFAYRETDDQLRCIEEIKADMESPLPMDRLLCGDVGFGKTEVAIRAIFKAVMDGKQVAYLVPTTILAQQMEINMKKRFSDFPVIVDMISRFRTVGEQKKTLKNLKAGRVDVLIGTHRILQKDIDFKNLGLLIVDEEQKFGVGHKEKIKEMSPGLDVLTLTATPIPRTLHMSLVGIRDISTIQEPPEERFPVQTYVMEYQDAVVQDALNRELARGGQVYYLYNRVKTIHKKFEDIRKLVPSARVAIGHGQMNENELENVMMDFIDREYDILVCTTIIESGLDMQNVNTIIIEDADRMGLAQLYQLRGRVGRSNRLAYAYVTYKKDKILNEAAEKRLNAIREFTEFGSGFKIALRDLEIRGAGNIIGGEQHGHMESVGYEMYCKLLEQAVKEERAQMEGQSQVGAFVPIEDINDILIEINSNAYIDVGYISSEDQKIEMYKKISLINDEDDALDVQDELMDRFGMMPQEVLTLINVALIKAYAQKNGFSFVQEKKDSFVLKYRKHHKIDMDKLGKAIGEVDGKVLFSAGSEPYIIYKFKDNKEEKRLIEVLNLLKKL